MWYAECYGDSSMFALLFRDRLNAVAAYRDEFVAYAYDQVIGYVTSKFSRRLRKRREDAGE
jgi:hypothetical protein